MLINSWLVASIFFFQMALLRVVSNLCDGGCMGQIKKTVILIVISFLFSFEDFVEKKAKHPTYSYEKSVNGVLDVSYVVFSARHQVHRANYKSDIFILLWLTKLST